MMNRSFDFFQNRLNRYRQRGNTANLRLYRRTVRPVPQQLSGRIHGSPAGQAAGSCSFAGSPHFGSLSTTIGRIIEPPPFPCPLPFVCCCCLCIL
ncbi:hypothetical protein [Sphingobacterium athyrii]|uniref:hypothetical protein n=1 Tax=Sphingobacterium athyrii TaxID=2152717 RepID=UPI0011B21838|nr:hypothetical protein [Sphingobacterium athyrii]